MLSKEDIINKCSRSENLSFSNFAAIIPVKYSEEEKKLIDSLPYMNIYNQDLVRNNVKTLTFKFQLDGSMFVSVNAGFLSDKMEADLKNKSVTNNETGTYLIELSKTSPELLTGETIRFGRISPPAELCYTAGFTCKVFLSGGQYVTDVTFKL